MSITGIYKITNPSGSVYIGQTIDFDRRVRFYKNLKSGSQFALIRSFVKYGFERHLVEMIHQLPQDIDQSVLDTYEMLYIDLYRSSNHRMLNIREGGSAGRHSEESKKRISKNHANFSGSMHPRFGKPVSDETRAKIGMANKGKPSPNKGNKYSDERKKQMSEARMGKKLPESQVLAMSKPVLQIQITGEKIKKWDSLSQAARALGLGVGNISACCRRVKKSCGGFKWAFDDLGIRKEPVEPRRLRRTKKQELSGLITI